MMNMNDIKAIVAENITELRKIHNLTQAELADKLNYTDKAISKWERAESTPDIEVLYHLSEIFGVTIDYFVHENAKNEIENFLIPQEIKTNRTVIASMVVSLVWLLATIIFVYTSINTPIIFWQVFLWALPVSGIVLLVFNGFWGRRKNVFIIMSEINWTLLACVFIQLLDYNLWLIFILGIPTQVLIVLWSKLKLN
ncbi:MAG: helix-turn-helix transcriptional regulator [Candidatus Izemoplasmatales bacterium]|jgi:transcriptional regulator with XRE-family HTH domain|nr:helix-turn-helix transcriptional regulator [Candidatus Izemoplasmatales bacterium]MDD4595742.1 helix-turn-helix transcriptional regulator [Candidatus Izemoplasmatales bacterium]